MDTFSINPTFAHWAHWSDLLSVLPMYPVCAWWVFRSLSPVFWVWGPWEIFRYPSPITTNLIGNVGPGTCQSPPSTTYPIGGVGPCPQWPPGSPNLLTGFVLRALSHVYVRCASHSVYVKIGPHCHRFNSKKWRPQLPVAELLPREEECLLEKYLQPSKSLPAPLTPSMEKKAEGGLATPRTKHKSKR